VQEIDIGHTHKYYKMFLDTQKVHSSDLDSTTSIIKNMFGTFIKTRSTKAQWEDGYGEDGEELIKGG
jgi:hypothetical protein